MHELRIIQQTPSGARTSWRGLRLTAVTGAAAVVMGALSLALPSSGAIVAGGSLAAHAHHAQQGRDIKFQPAPAIFPAGAEMAVMQGDPSKANAMFTVRLRFPDGYVLPAHWHPTDENVTVISGTFLVGMGDRFNPAALLPPLRAGGFITAPANANHFATVRGRTVVQVHAMGPFQLTYVNSIPTKAT